MKFLPRLWPALVIPFLVLSLSRQEAAAQCTTPAGATFTESFGDSSNYCWPGGPAECTQPWAAAGSNYSIAASPAGSQPDTACANSLLLTASATPASLQTFGTIPDIPAGTTVDLYFTVYIMAAPADSDPFIQLATASTGSMPAQIVWRNSSGTFMYAAGSTSSANTPAISLNAWHSVQLHIDAAAQNSFIALDGGTRQTFTAGPVDINSIVINGDPDGTYFIGNMYIDSPGYGPTGAPMLLDFSGATSGSPVTSAALNAGSHCVTRSWMIDNNVSGLTFSNAVAQDLHTPVIACGASYLGDTGVSVQFDMSTMQDATYFFDTLSSSVSVGFFYRTTLLSTDESFYCNANLTGSAGDYACVHTHGNGSSLQLYLEVNAAPELFGPPINISPNTWYWITVQYNAGGTHHMQVYEAQNWTSLGSIDAPSSHGTDLPSRFFFGHTGSNLAPPGSYLYFSNIELDWVNAAFPLGPGQGGAGIDPISGSTLSATVTAGDTATYHLSLSPQVFSGTVNLTCSENPPIPNTACSVSPNPAFLGGSGSAAVTVTVTTSPRNAIIPNHTPRSSPLNLRGIGAFTWLLVSALSPALLAAGWKGKKKIPVAISGAFLLALFAGACGGTGSYNSSGNPPPRPSGTPAGKYQILVTASSSGISQTATLTLIVK
jgi:hypothetical protein